MRNAEMCPSDQPCFGKTIIGECKVLVTPYKAGTCPFQKPERDVTKGKRYPYNMDYLKLGNKKSEIEN